MPSKYIGNIFSYLERHQKHFIEAELMILFLKILYMLYLQLTCK